MKEKECKKNIKILHKINYEARIIKILWSKAGKWRKNLKIIKK